MLDTELPSCDNSHAPCAIPEDVRNPPLLDDLKSQDGVRNALEDCNEAETDERKRQMLSMNYLKFPQKTVGAATTECNTYGYDFQAAAACDDLDDCMGFTVTAGSDRVECLLIAGLVVEPLLGDGQFDLFLKREELSGALFEFSPSEWTPCDKRCDGGSTTRTLACRSTKDVSRKLGMCSGLVAMNPDALPPTTGLCNVYNCTHPADVVPADRVDTLEEMVELLVQEDVMPTEVIDVLENRLSDIQDFAVSPETTPMPASTTTAMTTSAMTTSAASTTTPSTTTPTTTGAVHSVSDGYGIQTGEYFYVGPLPDGDYLNPQQFYFTSMYKGMYDGHVVMNPNDCFPPPEGTTHVLYNNHVYSDGNTEWGDVCNDPVAAGLVDPVTGSWSVGWGWCEYVIAGEVPANIDWLQYDAESANSDGLLFPLIDVSDGYKPCTPTHLFMAEWARHFCDWGEQCPPWAGGAPLPDFQW